MLLLLLMTWQKLLRRLQSLLNSHPNPGLCKRLIGRVLLPLWTLSSWPNSAGQTKESYSSPSAELLKIYFSWNRPKRCFKC